MDPRPAPLGPRLNLGANLGRFLFARGDPGCPDQFVDSLDCYVSPDPQQERRVPRDRITVPHLGARKVLLHVPLRLINHPPAPHGDCGRNRDTWEHPLSGPREPVHGIHRHLVRELLSVVHLLHRTRGGRHVLFRLFTKLFEFFEHRGEQARNILGEPVRPKLFVHDPGNICVLGVEDQRGVAQIVRNHDGWVQTLKVQGCDWRVVRPGLGLEHRRPRVPLLGTLVGSPPNRGNLVPEFARLARHLGKHLDLLAPLRQVIDWDPGRLGHLQEVQEIAELVHQEVGQHGILDAVLGHLPKFIRVAPGKPPKHLLGAHVQLLVPQKVLGHGVERVRIELLFALDIVEQVKDESARHRENLEHIVPQGARGQLLVNQFARNVPKLSELGKLHQAPVHGGPDVQKLEVEPENVPARHNVHVVSDQVRLEGEQEFALRVKRDHLGPGCLLVAQARPIKQLGFPEALECHRNLKARIGRNVRVRKLARRAVRLNVKGCDDERGEVIAGHGEQEAPVGAKEIHVAD